MNRILHHEHRIDNLAGACHPALRATVIDMVELTGTSPPNTFVNRPRLAAIANRGRSGMCIDIIDIVGSNRLPALMPFAERRVWPSMLGLEMWSPLEENP